MIQGRKSYGPTMKTRRDLRHFKKNSKESLKDNIIEETLSKKIYIKN